ncbi:rod shape-determining protein MreC [Hydrogenophaga crassostreae]|uniref:Cell shape-determining protein MreC n=1 Tax=Hydrogenophaga crassostreae TaxID=1763535 RepID=A0A167GSF0_9BURK|nr:rod shape-determining protein MreC [Hydrogenophaga crassostreae]AOW11721.1 rod shape-determining protein MreC [Hydrogenophaga crassostreae]OAD39813.1 rod shape-determining protein MreC [Hydrogenophaga crassostreae]
MPLGTLDRTPPPFFKQGPSALSKLMVFSAVALFLMVADMRFSITVPVRSALATVLYPMQWLVMQPVRAAGEAGTYFTSLHKAQASENAALVKLATQSEHALQVEQLRLENQRLRELLAMRERILAPSIGAQVLYDAADPFSRRVVIDRGQTHGVVAGSPVIDDNGVLGQVTRVYPLMSEVTLLIDSDYAIPVLNVRTGVRSVAFGRTGPSGEDLELRYTLANADIEQGDLLTTTGVDGVFPPGLPVARVKDVGERAESSFNRISCTPLARVHGALHVLVLTPVGLNLPPSPMLPKPGASTPITTDGVKR